MRIYYNDYFDEYHIKIKDNIYAVFCPWMWKRADFYLGIIKNTILAFLNFSLLSCIFNFVYYQQWLQAIILLMITYLIYNKEK